MKAYTYIKNGRFGLLDKPKPELQDPKDAIVRVTMSSICSSDLHIKHGSVPYADQGLNRIPDGVSDKQALLVGDVLATGFWAARISEIKEDGVIKIAIDNRY